MNGIDHHPGRVLSMKMLETPATSPIYARKLRSRITGRTERLYSELSNGGRLHSESLISSVANSALEYATDDTREIHMPGGFDENRFRIIIEFLESSMGTAENISYIQAYSDVYDFTDVRGVVDFPNEMRIYFNEVRTLAVKRKGNLRNDAIRHIRDTSQILSSIDDTRDNRSFRRQETHLLTPGVVTQLMQADKVHEQLGYHADEIEINDTRSSLIMCNNHRSRSDNRIPTHYLTRVLDGYARSRFGDLHRNNDHMKTLANVVRKCGDAPLTNSKFFETLVSESEYDVNGYVTWREFKRMFPEVMDRDCDVSIHELGRDRIKSTIDIQYTTSWNDASLETSIANITVSGIPPMLHDLLIEEVSFIVTNETDTGEVDVQITSWNSMYDDLDLTKQLEELEYRIAEYLFNGPEWVNNVEFLITGSVSLMFESQVAVSVDREEEQVYRFPNYADALATPLISTDQADALDIARDIKKLIGIIDDTVDQIAFESSIKDTSPRSRREERQQNRPKVRRETMNRRNKIII